MGTRPFSVGPGGIPKGRAEDVCVLEGDVCLIGLRRGLWPWRRGGTSQPLSILTVCLWQVDSPL